MLMSGNSSTDHATAAATRTATESSATGAAEAAAQVLSLHEAAEGRRWRIKAVAGGVELQRALARLGLRPGLCIEVAQHTRCGPVVVVADGLKLALGTDAAEHLLVAPC